MGLTTPAESSANSEAAARSDMDPDLIEQLADAVHQGWVAEKVAQGFADHAFAECALYPGECAEHARCHVANATCAVPADKHHTDMLPYADLAENIKEYDRATVRAVLLALDAAGLAVVTFDALRQLGTAVGLLNSMLLCGEQHSDTSRAVVKAAMSYRIVPTTSTIANIARTGETRQRA